MNKKVYRFISILLVLLMLAPSLSIYSFSDENGEVSTATQEDAKNEKVDVDEDIKEYVDAEVPEEWEEIHIKTANDLLELANNCRLDIWSRNKAVYLDNDISVIGMDFTGIPTFGGIFDGQGNSITDLDLVSSESYLALFNYVQPSGVIKDLKVSGRVIPQGRQTIIGSIAGSNAGIISNCKFTGVVKGEDYVGGIVGINELTGIIIDCDVEGYVSGVHFTGGIAGENMGNIISCLNMSAVNITNPERTLSLSDVDLEAIKGALLLEDSGSDSAESYAMINGVSDVGGIAGVSIGVIQFCLNGGDIGYEYVGYNIGGIAGRQSGYIYSCANKGTILGRKDVGGIVGQAEPYITLDFANDVTAQLGENIEKLHDIISVTLMDAGTESDTISNRLSIIQAFTNNALVDTRFLQDATVDWTNGVIDASNEALSRIDYILDETAKKDGVMDKANSAASNSRKAAQEFAKTIDDLDIYKYMSDEQQKDYEKATSLLKDATREYSEYYEDMYEAYYNYYLDGLRRKTKYSDGTVNEKDLCLKIDNDGNYDYKFYYSDSYDPSLSDADIKDQYKTDGKGIWIHYDSGNEKAFPYVDDDDQYNLDSDLIEDAGKKAEDATELYADAKYAANHQGHAYDKDIAEASSTVSSILMDISDELSDQTREDAKRALDYLGDAANDVSDAGNQGKEIVDDINSREDINLPNLSPEYKQHATSLTDNLQAMLDNFGLLNSEMNGASDVLLADLSAVNDQFEVIMLLFTDAVDGVLDNDYSDVYEDNSMEVAEFTQDATIAYCTNYGTVIGSIDASGIAGTMAIEYAYDLESDITGIKDAAMNRTYLTKCVLRRNVNLAPVKAQKNYSAGICALQEMGTIIGCENYAVIESDTASYVGGIAGKSLSNIVRCYSKCTLRGATFIGGIAGDATNIYDSLAMVKVLDATSWYGAIAGHVNDNGVIRDNFFIGTELAGIDRISYTLKAEPINYEDALLIENVPESFASLKVTFVLKDDIDEKESYIVLDEAMLNYGEELKDEYYPQVMAKEGYYIKWDKPENSRIFYDEIIEATYVRNVTTLAGSILRNNGQSAILVDGTFEETDVLKDEFLIGQSDELDNCCEYYNLEIPYDGNMTHTIRYIKNEAMKESPKIYYYDGSKWCEIDENSMNKMGEYTTFEIEGNSVKLQMVYSNKKYELIYMLILIAGIVFAIALIIVIVVVANKNKNRVKKKVKKVVKENIDNLISKDSAVKFATPEDVLEDKTEDKAEDEDKGE